MREVTTETELVEKEREVEYVYCDECGDECTDDVGYEVREVCSSCSMMERKRFPTLEKARVKANEHIKDDIPLGVYIVFTVAAPLLFLSGVSASDEAGKLIVVSMIGATLWLCGLFLLLLLVL